MKTSNTDGNVGKYIVRNNYAGHNVTAGEVVYSINPDSQTGIRRIYTETNQYQLTWIESECILPISEFLKRKPNKNYYAIAYRHFIKSKLPYFIENTKTLEYGISPFRFESIGEALYFLDLNNRQRKDYQIVNFIN